MAESNKGLRDCYIYGSVHVRKPPAEHLEYVDKLVDYVLIEGVSTKVKLGPKFIAYWLPAYVGFMLVFGLEDLVSKLRGHRGDMKEIKAFFEARHKSVEVADRDMCSVIEYCFRRIKKWQPMLSLMWGVLIVLYPWMSSWLVSFFYLLPKVVVASLLFAILIFIIPLSYVSVFVVSDDCIRYRDEVVVRRVLDVIREHSVLIVRGRRHVPSLKEELKKHGIECRELPTSGHK